MKTHTISVGDIFYCPAYDYTVQITLVDIARMKYKYIQSTHSSFGVNTIESILITDVEVCIKDGYWLGNKRKVEPAIKIQSATTINNHTCKTCGNDRCNVDEKSCWKCGCSLR